MKSTASTLLALALALALALVAACSNPAPPADAQLVEARPPGADAALDAGPDAPRPDAAAADAPRPDAPRPDSPRVDQEWVGNVTCATPPPPGASLAAAPPTYSGGTCPKLVVGTNTITSKGSARSFILVAPTTPKAGEVLPVVFMWHWLKGQASHFLGVELQAAIDQQRFLAVLPEAKGDIDIFGLKLPWPITTLQTQARVDEELAFFDDMLACVAEQLAINRECVSTVGVSAGALFTQLLVSARSQHLASFISLSGGIGSPGGVNGLLRTAPPPAHHLPGLVLWGGPTDKCITLDFQVASQELEKQMLAGSRFFVECVHNCGHAMPPVVPAPGESLFASIWDFALRHPFWQ